MNRLFLLPSAVRQSTEVEAWLTAPDPLRQLARPWFETIRVLGPDVRELLHDGCPTACLGDAAFAYVAAFKTHVNIGFFHGAELDDPAGLLEGAGKLMRHVKVVWGKPVDEAALQALIAAAYQDIRARLGS